MTMGDRGKVAKLDLPAGAILKFPAGATVSQLTFPEECTLVMLADDTVTTPTAGVIAKDDTGALWISRLMNVEGKMVYGFIKKL